MTRQRPHRSTLEQWLAATEDPDLFVPCPQGHLLVAPQLQLQRRWGRSHGSVSNRIAALCRAQPEPLAYRAEVGLVVRTDTIRAIVEGRVVRLATRATAEFHAAAAQRFTAGVAADGTPMFLRDDGRPATHRDLAELGGWSSLGTVAKHLRAIRESGGPEAEGTPWPEDAPSVLREPHGSMTASGFATSGAKAGAGEMVRAIDALTALATSADDDVLRNTALDCIARLASLGCREGAASSRPEIRRGAAFRDRERGAGSTRSVNDVDADDHQLRSARPIRGDDASPRGEARRSPTGAVPAVAATDRDLGPFEPVADWRAALEPVVTAWGRRRGREPDIGENVGVWMAQWPATLVEHAVDRVAGHIDGGRPIAELGAFLCALFRDGWTEYLPLGALPEPDRRATSGRQTGGRARERARERASILLAISGDDIDLLADAIDAQLGELSDRDVLSVVRELAGRLELTARDELAARIRLGALAADRGLAEQLSGAVLAGTFPDNGRTIEDS